MLWEHYDLPIFWESQRMIGKRKTPKVVNVKEVIFIQIYNDITHNNVEEKVGQLLPHLVLTSL